MRVLLVGSYGPSLLNFRRSLIIDMVRYGHDVHVAAPNIGNQLKWELEALGVVVHDVPLDRQSIGLRSDLKYLKELTILFYKAAPDIVITYTIKPNIWGAFAGYCAGTRTVALITGLGIMFTDTGEESTIRFRLMKTMVYWLYRRASSHNWRIFFQNSDDLADFVAAGCLRDQSKVRFMNGSGIDLSHYAPAPLPATPNFLMISRILGAKGVREYASASISVKKTYPEARFRLVGFYDQGPDAVSKAEVAEWVECGLEYLGPSDDVRQHLADCWVYVLPSYREGTPRSVLEAMATGRAILTSDAPGCRETVIDGENGFLVPVRDVKTLSARMREMIENPELATCMGAASLKLVREKYDVHKVNDQLLRDLELI